MSIQRVSIAVALVAGLLAGCGAAQPNSLAAAPPTSQELSAQAMLDITGPTGYHVMTLTAWNKADIDHVVLTLLKDNGSGSYAATGATKTVVNAALTSALTLKNLRYGANYKVSAKAFGDAAEATEIDNTAEAGSDAASSTTFSTPALVAANSGDTVSDSALAITIPVRLRNKTYAGQASGSGVGVTNGTIVNTTTPETF